MGEPVTVPKEIHEMAIMVMADRKMQGWTPDELEEMREDFRQMAQENIEDFREYLDTQCKPIRHRQQLVRDAIARIKERIEIEAKEQERRAA